jgi:sugar phosphate isomerase/epimerase
MAATFALSTASVYPESVAHGFEYAARLGYDAVEVMVSIDAVSQDVEKVRRLRDYHEVPVCAVHAPCLLITQRVWGTDPWVKLDMSAEMAHELGADVVVVHPPFRWQREYATEFVEGIARLEEQTGLAFAVENMYPWRATSRRAMDVYQPHWDPSEEDYANTTIDLSHAATAHSDPIEMARRLGGRLRHVHMTDGSGSAKDEHLVPGRGSQPCGEFLEHLAESGFEGHIVAEINTRKAGTRESREADLLATLAFSQLHFARAHESRRETGSQAGA